MRTLASSILFAAVGLGLTIPLAAAVPDSTIFVSHTGSDAAGCGNVFNPCATFATALATVPVGGVISCLDSGSYGPLNIGQPVTIDCGGQPSSITATSGNGITITGTGIVVTLRGLNINADVVSGGGQYGIAISASGAVTIENCVIENFIRFAGAGINVTPTGSLQLNVTDTLIVNNSPPGPFGGIMVVPSGSGTVNFVFDRIRVENNIGNNIFAQASGTGVITGLIRDSVLTGSPGVGVYADAGNTATATVTLNRTDSVGNVSGAWANNGAAIILNNSTIQLNAIGLKATNGGAIFSYGNNTINGNQPGGIGTAPILIGQH
jgi:hypothetical protein